MKRFDKVNPDPTIEEMRAVVCDQKVSTLTLHTITITIIVNTIYINIIIIIIMVYCRLDQSSWEPGRRTLSCDVLQRSANIFRLFDETDFHLKKSRFFAGDARVLVREHPCAPLRAQDQEELDRDPGAVMEDDCGGGDPGAVVEIFLQDDRGGDAFFNLNVSLCKFYLQAEDSGVGDE